MIVKCCSNIEKTLNLKLGQDMFDEIQRKTYLEGKELELLTNALPLEVEWTHSPSSHRETRKLQWGQQPKTYPII